MVDFKFVCSICNETIKTSKTNYYQSLKKDKNICRSCHLKESSKSLSILVEGDRVTKHRFYSLWCNMIRRCYDSKSSYYKYYGGRGIKVCDEWRSSANFIRWVLDVENIIGKVDRSVQLDRIDNDKGYSPKNCQFITPRENNRKRPFVKLNYKKHVRYVKNTLTMCL